MKKPESFMITRAKILAVRASGVRRLLTFLSQMRHLFEGGAYSSKYGIQLFVSSVGSIKSLYIH